MTQFGYSEQIYDKVLENIGAEWKFDSAREQQFQGAADIMLKLGQIKAKPDLEQLYAREFWNA